MRRNYPGVFYNDNLSEDIKCYIFGLIITDGCVRKTSKNSKSICISLKDKYMIEMIRDIVCPTKKIYRDGENWQVVWTNEYDVEFLDYNDIRERKSYSVRLPYVKCMSDLIRGIFDGDGSVFESTTHDVKHDKYYKYLYVSITSASKLFLEDIKSYLLSIGIRSRINKDNRHFCTYQLRITRKDDVAKFRDYIYQRDNEWKLKRKYEKF